MAVYDNSNIEIDDDIECVSTSYYHNQYSDIYVRTRLVKQKQPIWYDSRDVCRQLKLNSISIKSSDFYDILLNEDSTLKVVLPREPNNANYWADSAHPMYEIFALNEYHPRYGNHPIFSQQFIDEFILQYANRLTELDGLLASEIEWESDIPPILLKLLQKKRFKYYQVYKSRLYVSYLKSRRWQKIRTAVINRDKCCTSCGSNSLLEIHHTSYRYCFIETTTNLSTLTTLCRACHRRQHGKS